MVADPAGARARRYATGGMGGMGGHGLLRLQPPPQVRDEYGATTTNSPVTWSTFRTKAATVARENARAAALAGHRRKRNTGSGCSG